MIRHRYAVWTGLSLAAAVVAFALSGETPLAPGSPTDSYGYVCDTLLGAALEIDTDTRRVRRVFSAENHPRNLEVSPDGGRLYLVNTGWTVETEKQGSVSVFDLTRPAA